MTMLTAPTPWNNPAEGLWSRRLPEGTVEIVLGSGAENPDAEGFVETVRKSFAADVAQALIVSYCANPDAVAFSQQYGEQMFTVENLPENGEGWDQYNRQAAATAYRITGRFKVRQSDGTDVTIEDGWLLLTDDEPQQLLGMENSDFIEAYEPA